jgi:Undecaprenyl-phosphate glucose phosphotransferase
LLALNGVVVLFENSAKTSGYFDLSHGAFYEADAQPLDELEAKRPVLRTRAVLQHFAGVSLICDFLFFITSYSVSPLSFASLLRTPSGLHCALLSLVLTVFSLIIFYLSKLYRVETIANFRFFCARFLLIAVSVLVASEIEDFMVSPGGPQAAAFNHSLIAWAGITVILFLAMHYAISEAFRVLVARGYASHNVAVIGTSAASENFIRKLHESKLGVRVLGVFGESFSASRSAPVAGIPVGGGVAALLQYTKHHPIDTVVIASESPISFNLNALVEQISVQPLRIAILPPQLLGFAHIRNTPFAWSAPSGSVPGVNLVYLADLPIRGLGGVMKSALDIVVALAALVLFGPLMLICAAGIKLASPGPVFFVQKRIGYRNNTFWIYKFRTMHAAACNTGVLTQRNDPRIFKFGEIMRKFSLDELPQLLNVLKGDMSLVGPRPHIQEARAAGILYFKAVRNYPARHRVKPGITGYAQISGWRGPTETIEQIENRVAHDLHYVENWSFFGDIKILVKTLFVGFFGKNAF